MLQLLSTDTQSAARVQSQGRCPAVVPGQHKVWDGATRAVEWKATARARAWAPRTVR